MTSTPVGGVGRSPGEPVRPLSVLALSPAIVVLLLAGLLLRLLVAYVLFPGSGFESDLASYASWAQTMVEYGPGGFYETPASPTTGWSSPGPRRAASRPCSSTRP